MENTSFFYLTNQSNPIEIRDEINTKNYDFLVIPSENLQLDFHVHLQHGQTKKLNIGIYNHQHFQIQCRVFITYADQFNTCEVQVIALGADQSQTNVTVDAIVQNDNNKIHQSIKGFLLSDQAKISGLPLLNIETNEIVATHGLAIGSLNKEQMFYLMTKGFSFDQVKQILLLSQFQTLLVSCSDQDKEFYLDQINQLWSKNSE